MAVFFRGSFENRLDKKGRVSVPADFRARLKGQSFDGIVAFPSIRHGSKFRVLECSGTDRADQLGASIDATKVTAGQTDEDIQFAIMNSRDLPFDTEGRVVLPLDQVAHLGAPERVTFVGMGPYFEIWPAEAHAARANGLLQARLAAADRALEGGGQ